MTSVHELPVHEVTEQDLPSAGLPLTVRAFAQAEELHRTHVRKGSKIPYLSHLTSVAGLVLEDGGDDTTVAAALLHDAVEDQGGLRTLALIRDEFDGEVADIVMECSDTAPEDRADKEPWKERKERFIAAMPGKSEAALRVIAADKLHNSQATLADLADPEVGAAVWDRFKTGREGFMWFHKEMLKKLDVLLPGSRSVAGLHRVLDEILLSEGRATIKP